MSGRDPILVIGAHRSGTSVLSRILEELGVFVGRRLDPNHEATFFLRLNDWLLRQSGGRWDHPEPVLDLLADNATRRLCAEYLELCMRTPRAIGYLGPLRYLRHRGIARLPGPWGFKDPRCCFTLPIWLDLFPDARVVHIHRHGVDAASSLVRRHRAHLERSRAAFARNRPWLGFLPKRAGFGESVRCATLEGALGLWEIHVRQATVHVKELGDQALELSYERLAADPRDVIEEVARFCGLTVSPGLVQRAAATVRGERASAHARDPELAAFAAKFSDRIECVRSGVRTDARTARPAGAPGSVG